MPTLARTHTQFGEDPETYHQEVEEVLDKTASSGVYSHGECWTHNASNSLETVFQGSTCI